MSELIIAMKNIKQSIRLRPCIIFLLTFILAALALVVKWSILKPIHDTIVYRYKHDLPLYYIPSSICHIMNMEIFNVLVFPVSCFIIVICIVITKRTSLLRNKCHGYVAPPIPVDFLSHIDRKFAAIIFAICADELFGIVRNFFNNYSSSNKEGIILQYLDRVLEVLIIGFRYYPLLATVYLDTISALICGTIYAWLNYSITIINQAMCTSDYYITFEDYNTTNNGSSLTEKLKYYGTGSQLLILQLCIDIPRLLCLSYVCIKLPTLLIGKIYERLKENSLSQEEQMMLTVTREERVLLRASQTNSSEMLYVRNLFRSTDQRPRTCHLLGRLIPKFIYEWRDDFYFSTRVLCVYSSILLLLFFITVQACVQILPALHSIQKKMQDFFDFMSIFGDNNENTMYSNTENKSQQYEFPVPNLQPPYVLAVTATVLIIIIQLLALLVNIRRNLLQSFRGDDSEIPRRQRSKYISYAIGNMHFAGYFIGYLIWGYIIIAIFTSILCICIEALIIYRNARFLESLLKAIIPTLLLIYFKTYLNKLLAQYVFLQHYGRVLAINNRRMLMIFIYFNFFLDAFLGFVSSIIRLIKSVMAGMLYMCRFIGGGALRPGEAQASPKTKLGRLWEAQIFEKSLQISS
ncbi:unnamed protein product [Rotaria sp. Silwood1]|nr:unnamed protein product [Rotaria sp. Silwood1]